jgi:hypothetical protein
MTVTEFIKMRVKFNIFIQAIIDFIQLSGHSSCIVLWALKCYYVMLTHTINTETNPLVLFWVSPMEFTPPQHFPKIAFTV